jgi:HEAT repeat protein
VAGCLVPMLEDPDNDVRLATVKALGHLPQTPASTRGLMLALVDEERSVRVAAESALDQISPDWTRSAEAGEAIELMETRLATRPVWVRGAVMATMSRLRGEGCGAN